MWERVVYRDWGIRRFADLRILGAANFESANHPISKSVNGYNIVVADEPKSRVVSAETIGLIVIAVMLAIMILARWASIIAWSAR
jgi:hypothetical protein